VTEGDAVALVNPLRTHRFAGESAASLMKKIDAITVVI
jgi:hypothetical protein